MSNPQEIENRFRQWAVKTVDKEKSIDDYIKYSLNNLLPRKLKDLEEKDDSFKSIFEITDIQWLQNFITDCKKKI